MAPESVMRKRKAEKVVLESNGSQTAPANVRQLSTCISLLSDAKGIGETFYHEIHKKRRCAGPRLCRCRATLGAGESSDYFYASLLFNHAPPEIRAPHIYGQCGGPKQTTSGAYIFCRR